MLFVTTAEHKGKTLNVFVPENVWSAPSSSFLIVEDDLLSTLPSDTIDFVRPFTLIPLKKVILSVIWSPIDTAPLQSKAPLSTIELDVKLPTTILEPEFNVACFPFNWFCIEKLTPASLDNSTGVMLILLQEISVAIVSPFEKVGAINGAFSPIKFVMLVEKFGSFPNAVAISFSVYFQSDVHFLASSRAIRNE